MSSPTALEIPLRDQGETQIMPAEKDSTFAMQWQPTDASSLQPANLSLTRAPRAWERKPLSPFSRSKMRVGKVWKRAAPVEIRKRRSLGGAGAKPVKKMRLDDGGGMSVARWEGDGQDEARSVGSPTRKIVLRRDRVVDGELAALADEEELEVQQQDAEEEGVVEVFDEQGTLLDVDPEDVEGQEEWEDEEFNPTMMHLADVVEQAQEQASVHPGQSFDEQADEQSEEPELPIDPALAAKDLRESFGPVQPAAADSTNPLNETKTEEVVLPAGFVSPLKQSTAPKPRSIGKSLGSRRRTLPTEWRPSRLRQVVNAEESEDEKIIEAPEQPVEVQVYQTIDEGPGLNVEPVNEMADQDWEDVEDEPLATELDDAMDDAPAENQAASESLLEDMAQTDVSSDTEELQVAHPTNVLDSVRLASPSKLSSSPVPSIEGQHPRLPLRRSPRRKSSSPVKQRITRLSTEHPHLVAFTPIKGLHRLSAFAESPAPLNQSVEEEAEDDSAPPLLERSVSAPPEEPTMSPHRPQRPRVSDDTALLQAFLNRAAETKSSGRRISATKRESITNRRDSDAVRQALASPVKPEVLADLDPNSPSPRKPTVVSDEIDDANILPEPEPSPLHKTRRSGRATRKAAPPTATPAAAPNKISIRGNSDGVVLKKDETQELSKLTRTNTRKNKGGAILPLYRLSKLQQQGITDSLDDGSAEAEEPVSKPNSKGKSLQWNETLVEFWQGGDVSETSLLSDELSAPGQPASDKMEVESEVPPQASAPPPPAETPSKPKMRRLKTPRTAAAPSKTASTPAETAEINDTTKEEPAAAPPKAPAPTKRRSRIATPAKGLSNSSLLPADLEPTPTPAPAAPAAQQQQPQSQQRKRSIPAPTAGKRKPPASKLPAPASSTATPAPGAPNLSSSLTSSQQSNTTASIGQGKENLISSPPKKKPAPATGKGMPTTKTFAPKLDFGKSSTSLAPATSSSQDQTLPGLASPAKKAGRKGVMFAPPGSSFSSAGGSQEDSKEKDEAGQVPLGLRSPAKKRTRRAVAMGH